MHAGCASSTRIGMLAVVLCLGAPTQTARAQQAEAFSHAYVLSFNRFGELRTPIERDQIIEDLSADRSIRRILIVSYGWSYDGEASYESYRELLRSLREEIPDGYAPARTAVIAVGWDSGQTGFRKLLNDLLPFPVLASAAAFVPDNVLFPISFWSKAAMADRVGFGGLRSSLNQIFGEAYPEGRGHPDIYLLGHSFGTRILSGLMQDRLALLPVGGESFESARFVRGAAMVQPALALPNLHRTGDYPVLVTQSRHDHANGALFPVANLIINAYAFTSFEAIFRHRIVPLISEPVEMTTQGIAYAAQLPLQGFGRDRKKAPEPEERAAIDAESWDPFGLAALRRPTDHVLFLFQRGLAEAASVPIALLYSAIATPVNYLSAQVEGLAANPFDHVMNTLAQLPVVEIPVEGLARLVGREVPWGRRSKGFLNLGLTNESSGRVLMRPWSEPRDLPTYSLSEFEEASGAACGLPVCRGVLFVDASSIIDEGIFGLSLENPIVDFTLGWLDPLGAHADYPNPEIVELIARLVMHDDTASPQPALSEPRVAE